MSDGLPHVQADDDEPPVGTSLLAGAPVGSGGDGIRFIHVDNSEHGWEEIVNGGRATRVPWPRVAFWGPLRRAS